VSSTRSILHIINYISKQDKELKNFKKSIKNNFVPIYFEHLILKYHVKNYCVKFLKNKILPKFNYSGDSNQDRTDIIFS